MNDLPAHFIRVKSHYDVDTTTDRLEAVLTEKGMTLFTRVNHALGAQKVGLSLKPMQLVIFGNPNIGTALIQNALSAGIDLPLKALIYEDEEECVWIAYNAPKALHERHGLVGCEAVIEKMTQALTGFVNAAAV